MINTTGEEPRRYYTKEQVDEVFLFARVNNGRSKTECIRLFDMERRYFF